MDVDPSQRKKLGKLGEEEGEPVTERRIEHRNLGLDLGKREEQVVCHTSVSALEMTDEAHLEAEMYAWRSSSFL